MKNKELKILFYPDPLLPKCRVFQICNEYGIKFTNNPKEKYDLHIFWSYTKKDIIPDNFTLTDKNVINRGCWDIGKERVNEIFGDLTIDPRLHKGVCVEKSIYQSRHDLHKIITCPAPKKEGFIYQVFIENKDKDLYYSYRYYYAEGAGLLVKQFKTTPFASQYVKHEIVDKRSLFTLEQERDLVSRCNKFGVDFAGLDLMIYNGKPYVIDVNNIIGGGLVLGLTGTEVERKVHEFYAKYLYSKV